MNHLGAVRARRRRVNAMMTSLTVLAALLAVLPLAVILWHLLAVGARAVSPAFFLHMPRAVGESGGGMANAIVGTLILTGIASGLGIPVGVGAGLYLADHRGRLATTVRFLSDVLNGLPSIVIGIFVWQVVVRPVGHFSALAGGIALGLMVLPVVARTTEEMVRAVPASLSQAALALGFERWRTSLTIVLRSAGAGVVTGALVAIARVAGETAPLLFTALGNNFWSTSLTQPIAAMPLQIFAYAISPYDDWRALAWAGALVLIGIILVVNITARLATRRRFPGAHGD